MDPERPTTWPSAGSASRPASPSCAPSSPPCSPPATRSCAPRRWACACPARSASPPASTRTPTRSRLASWASASSRSAPSPASRSPATPGRDCSGWCRDRALINRMGFNNEGSRPWPRAWRHRNAVVRYTVGVNIGKTKVVARGRSRSPTTCKRRAARAARRLPRRQRQLAQHPGLRDLQATDDAAPAARRRPRGRRPQRPGPARPAAGEDRPRPRRRRDRRRRRPGGRAGLDGIIATNTTIARDGLGLQSAAGRGAGAGGLSGAPLQGTLARGAPPPPRPRRRPPRPDRGRRHRDRRGCLANASDAGATLVQGYTRLHLRRPVLGPRDPPGPRQPGSQRPVAKSRRAVDAETRKKAVPPHHPRSAPGCAGPWTPEGRSAWASTRTPRY